MKKDIYKEYGILIILGKVRSTKGLLIHVFGRLVAVY
jgi:hypothetical protein